MNGRAARYKAPEGGIFLYTIVAAHSHPVSEPLGPTNAGDLPGLMWVQGPSLEPLRHLCIEVASQVYGHGALRFPPVAVCPSYDIRQHVCKPPVNVLPTHIPSKVPAIGIALEAYAAHFAIMMPQEFLNAVTNASPHEKMVCFVNLSYTGPMLSSNKLFDPCGCLGFFEAHAEPYALYAVKPDLSNYIVPRLLVLDHVHVYLLRPQAPGYRIQRLLRPKDERHELVVARPLIPRDIHSRDYHCHAAVGAGVAIYTCGPVLHAPSRAHTAQSFRRAGLRRMRSMHPAASAESRRSGRQRQRRQAAPRHSPRH